MYISHDLPYYNRREYQRKWHITGTCASSTESISIFWGQIYTICYFGCVSRKSAWIILQAEILLNGKWRHAELLSSLVSWEAF